MSRKISITLPDVIIAAMTKKGKPFDLDAGDWLKQRLLMSAQGVEIPLLLGDLVAELQVTPAPTASPSDEPQLPLGGGRDRELRKADAVA